MLKQTTGRPRSNGRVRLRLESLEPRMLLAGDLVISELMAINDGTLADEDGHFEDWIEIHNPTAADVDLAGWTLTDDAADLEQWQFPGQTIPAGAYLVVFASGKDRALAGSELHTNFKLDGDGEYLALVEPDGQTVSHEFSPEFPQQLEGVSFGYTQEVTELFVPNAGGSTLGPLLAVDFQNSNGVSIAGVTQSGFEAFDNSDGGSATYSTAVGNVTVAMSGLDAALDGLYNRGGVANGGSQTFADVYNDFAFLNGVSSPQSMTLTLSGPGVAADTDYLLTFYSYDSYPDQGSHSVAYTGISGTAGSAIPLLYTADDNPTTDDQYAVAGTFTSDGTGVLTIDMTDTFSATGHTGIRLNAFEFEPAPARDSLLSVDFQNSNGVGISGLRQQGFEVFDNTNVTGVGTAGATYSTAAGNVTVAMAGMDVAGIDGLFNRGGVANGGALSLAGVYNDFAYKNGSDVLGGDSPQSMTLTLDGPGVVANTDYECTFYSYDSHPTQGSHSVAYSGISGTVGTAGPLLYTAANNPTADDQYAVTGTFTSDGTGVLTIDMTDAWFGATTTAGIRLNAFEISAASEPEPPGDIDQPDSVVLVPDASDAGLGTAWTDPTFTPDADWQSALMGIGFEGTDQLITATAYGNLVGATGTQEYLGALGHDFDVNHTIAVTELGVFDSDADGLARDLTAELWTRAGALLTSLTFTTAEPGTLVESDRFKPLAEPLELEPGNYTIVAHGYGPGEPNGNEGTGGPLGSHKTLDDGGGAIFFVGSARAGTAGTFPTAADGGPANRYSAGTFRFLAPPYAGLIETDLSALMLDQNASALARIEFEVEDPAAFDWLLLRMKYDDGFVAYLNGTEVARRNAPALLDWNSRAESERPPAESLAFEPVDLTVHLGELVPGTNVLALHGLNVDAADGDFLVFPELLAGTSLDSQPRYLDPPTPGAPNDSASTFLGFVADTTFDVDRGFYRAADLEAGGVLAQGVTIATATEGATIRFTTDGSVPTETNGNDYTGPVAITTTTTLRAAAFLAGYRPTNVDTHTYVFAEDVVAQPAAPLGFPTSWGGTTPDYAMDQNPADLALIAGDPDMTAEQYNAVIAESLLSLPTMSIVMDNDDLFGGSGIYANPTARGDAWERPASVEYILPDGTTGFQIDAGLQIMGNTSRNPSMTPKHSMRLLFKKEYGAGRLDYPLFPDAPVESYNTITLRANTRDDWPANDATYAEGTNATYIRDQWAKAAQAAMRQPATAGNFVHLYLNGLYWGLYNPTERPDAAFMADRTGGDDTDYDAIKFMNPRVVDGSIEKFNQLLDLSRAGLASDAAYQFVQGNNPDGTRNENYEVLLDVDNIIDYIINGQYHAAVDWPGNYYMVRDRRPESEGFKFFTWDNDLAFFKSNVDMDKSTAETDWRNFWWTTSPGVVDMALRENAEYRLHFADHVHRHLFNDGVYTPEAVAELWSSIAGQVEDAVVAESARWGDWLGPQFTPTEHWRPAIDNMLENYFPARTDVVLEQMRTRGLYPNIDAPEFAINAQPQHGGVIDAGDLLAMTTEAMVTSQDTTLVATNHAALAFVPTNGSLEPGVASPAWFEPDFDATGWLPGTGGVGYEDDSSGYATLIGLDIQDAWDAIGAESSAYTRFDFTLDAEFDPTQFDTLTLDIQYDDGFVAYLNGTEVVSRFAPLSPAWNSLAEGDGLSEPANESIDLTGYLNSLVPGDNLLAIRGLNIATTSSDMLIRPELVLGKTTSITNAPIYYTTDGTDPRGADDQPAGTLFTAALPLAGSVNQIKARALGGTEWSALSEASFVINPAAVGNLVVSEIYYNPELSADDEFIELQNISDQTIYLGGVEFDPGDPVEFTFPEGPASNLAPGETVLIVRSETAFASRFPGDHNWAGQFVNGQLNNGGEWITVRDASGETIQSFRYNDKSPWPTAADGDGASLQLIAPENGPDPTDPASWTATDPTPGAVLPPTVVGRYVFYAGSPLDDGADGAVAIDKTPLLPGENATLENITNYSSGINGIIVDLAQAPDAAALVPSDLALAVGNDDDPTEWGVASGAALEVFTRGGRGGSDRLVITWAVDAPTNTWLGVTVPGGGGHATTTGLVADDVFYFGNAIGETGDSLLGAGHATRPLVNSADVIAIRDSPRGPANPASIDNPHDIDRDGRVNATDLIFARDNATSPLSALRLIALSEPVAPPAGEGEFTLPTKSLVSTGTRPVESLDNLVAVQANRPAADAVLPSAVLSRLLRRLNSFH